MPVYSHPLTAPALLGAALRVWDMLTLYSIWSEPKLKLTDKHMSVRVAMQRKSSLVHSTPLHSPPVSTTG